MMIPCFSIGLGKGRFHDAHDVAQIAEITWLDGDWGSPLTFACSLATGHQSGGFRWLGIRLAAIYGLGGHFFHIIAH